MTGNVFDPYPLRQTARVTLECGHIRLMEWNHAVMGVAAETACFVCPERADGYHQVRQVVIHEDAETHWFDSMNSRRERR